MNVNGTDVVRGDIVILGTGDIVPADCRVLTSADFKVNEMLLTGEPDDVQKTHKVDKLLEQAKPKGGNGTGSVPSSAPAAEATLTPPTMVCNKCLQLFEYNAKFAVVAFIPIALVGICCTS